MRNAVIVGYKRSPFTFARKGEMANIRPEDILSQTINQLLNEIQINKNDIEDIITGCAYPEGACLLYTSPSPRDRQKSRMPSSA